MQRANEADSKVGARCYSGHLFLLSIPFFFFFTPKFVRNNPNISLLTSYSPPHRQKSNLKTPVKVYIRQILIWQDALVHRRWCQNSDFSNGIFADVLLTVLRAGGSVTLAGSKVAVTASRFKEPWQTPLGSRLEAANRSQSYWSGSLPSSRSPLQVSSQLVL